jgi:hypothetical protein
MSLLMEQREGVPLMQRPERSSGKIHRSRNGPVAPQGTLPWRGTPLLLLMGCACAPFASSGAGSREEHQPLEPTIGHDVSSPVTEPFSYRIAGPSPWDETSPENGSPAFLGFFNAILWHLVARSDRVVEGSTKVSIRVRRRPPLKLRTPQPATGETVGPER